MVTAVTRIQEMMSEKNIEDPSGQIPTLRPIIQPKFFSAPKCVVLVCASCQLAQENKVSPGLVKKKYFPTKKVFCLGINISLVVFIC